MLNGPFTPDRANPISEIAKTACEHGELVTALKLAGRLDFNPLTDELVSPGGEKFKLDPPTGHRLPSKGFDPGQDTYQESPEQGTEAEIHVDPTSERLHNLLSKYLQRLHLKKSITCLLNRIPTLKARKGDN